MASSMAWGVAVASLAVCLAVVAFFYSRFLPASKSAIESIVVPLFSNVSNNPNTECLSDGITDSVIDRLSQLPNLRVITRTPETQNGNG
jgi:TolB-like protein